MTTLAGSGSSSNSDTRLAVEEAVRDAMKQLGKSRATTGFLFAGPDRDLKAATHLAKELSGAEFVSASTAGEFTERGLLHGGVAVLLLASDEWSQSVAIAQNLRASHAQAAATLMAPAVDLRRTRSAHHHLTTVLLTDGLSGNGEDLVVAAAELAPGGTQIVGGAAADEGRFRRTCVGTSTAVASDACVALHVLSEAPWGIGVDHGLRSASRRMRVTKSRGNVIYELDRAPAFAAYREHAAQRGIALNEESAKPYMIANELGLLFFDKIQRARAPLSVGKDGSLVCAAAVPENSQVCILDGDPDSMIDAARRAAHEARERLDGRKAAAVLAFDCVCRGMILKDDFLREIEAVRSAFGSVPVLGFLTYGEIARYGGKLDGWHNTTAVVVAIAA